jgi:hypothetical protein
MLEMLVERNESGLLVQSIPVAWGLAVHAGVGDVGFFGSAD